MIYVASPYSSPDMATMRHRFYAVVHYINERLLQDMHTFRYSPIMYHHYHALQYNLPKDHVYWRDVNLGVFKHVTSMELLQLPGWELSRGCAEELEWAKEKNIEVVNVVPSEAVIKLANGVRPV